MSRSRIFRGHRQRRAFTLAETTLSLAIIGLISAACASILVISVRAIEANSRGPGASAVAARAVSDWITHDMKFALAFTERSATAVTMTVPDRTGDGSIDTIRYAWSGAAGATVNGFMIPPYTVTREYNGGNPVTLANDVRSFVLDYDTRDVGPQPPKEGAEEVLAWHEGAAGGNLSEVALHGDRWAAQSFRPVLLHNAIEWKITRVRLQMRRTSWSSTPLRVQIHEAASGGTPRDNTLATAYLPLGSVPTSADWVTVTFPAPAAGLDPTKTYCVVVTSSHGTSVARVITDSAASDAQQRYTTTDDVDDGDPDWNGTTSSRALQFFVYGTQTTQDPS